MMICSVEGCNRKAADNGKCKAIHGGRNYCSHADGCTKAAHKGGLCIKHGAKKKICSIDGCTNNVIQGGVCKRHGAVVKTCKHEGCTNQTKKRGSCAEHGHGGRLQQEQSVDAELVSTSAEQISRAAAVVSPTIKSDSVEQARAKVSIIESAEERYLSLEEERRVYEMGKDLQHVCDMRIDAYKDPHYTRELKKRFARNELPNPSDEDLEEAEAVLAEAKGLDRNEE